MDKEAFERFLKRGERSPSAVSRCLRNVEEFETFLIEQGADKCLEDAQPEDPEHIVKFIEY